MTEDFIGGVICGMVTCAVIALFFAIVHEVRKVEKKEPETDKKITDITVDAISLDMDVWNCGVTVALLIDTRWKAVADIDFAKLQQQNLPLGPRFIRSTTPINVVKSRKAPLVFGGYR